MPTVVLYCYLISQINLSPDKASVLKEVYRVLAPGGEMYFSDIYCDRRLPKEVWICLRSPYGCQ
jgi:ubiquinone/menaquinone biosynthesis C-methylase UbiE